MAKKSQRIYNVHTHIFTKDHTPKHLGKAIIPWPFYLWLEIPSAVAFIKRLFDQKSETYTHESRNQEWRAYKQYMAFKRSKLLIVINALRNLALLFVWIYFLVYLADLVLMVADTGWIVQTMKFITWIFGWTVINISDYRIKIGIVILIFLLFTSIRKMVLKFFWKRIRKSIGEHTLEFLLRYLNLLHFANRKYMATIYNDLKDQYPPDTRFVVLPMDMKYMDANDVIESYEEQMTKLLKLKSDHPDTLLPFVFVDPRRIAEEGKKFFDYVLIDGKIELKKCDLRNYLENGCCGIKIYPTLSYYPFDKELLPLWKFCCDNKIPITTHCSVGPIYYRGIKKKQWDQHDIFLEQVGNEVSAKTGEKTPIFDGLRLTDRENKDF